MKVSAIAIALLSATASAKKTATPKQAASHDDPTVRQLMNKVEQLSKDLTNVNSKLADEREARKELTAKIQSLEKAAPKDAKNHNVRRRAEDALPDEAPEEIGYGTLLTKLAYLEEALESIEKCVSYSEYSGYKTCTFGDDYNDIGVKILADTKIEMYADNNIKVSTDYGAIDLHAKNNINLDSDYGSVTVHAYNNFYVDADDYVTIKGYDGVALYSGYGDIKLEAYDNIKLKSDNDLYIASHDSIFIYAGDGYYDDVKISAGGDVGIYSAYGDIYGKAYYGDIAWWAFYNVFLSADYGDAPLKLGSYHSGKVEKDNAIAANATFVDPESMAAAEAAEAEAPADDGERRGRRHRH